MDIPDNLFRPLTLVFSKQYLRLERQEITRNSISNPVTFIAFDSSPAFVIVQNPDGIKFRCPRDEIYLWTDGNGREEAAKWEEQ